MSSTKSENEVAEYLAQDGSVQVIYSVAQPEGILVNSIHEEMDASRLTVTRLVEDAHRLGIIEQVMLRGDHGNAKRYALTERGRSIYDKCQELDLYKIHQQIEQLEEEHATRKEELTQWATEHETDASSGTQDSRVPEDFPHPENRYPHRNDDQ